MVLVEAELIAASLLDQEGEVVSLLSLPLCLVCPMGGFGELKSIPFFNISAWDSWDPESCFFFCGRKLPAGDGPNVL